MSGRGRKPKAEEKSYLKDPNDVNKASKELLQKAKKQLYYRYKNCLNRRELKEHPEIYFSDLEKYCQLLRIIDATEQTL